MRHITELVLLFYITVTQYGTIAVASECGVNSSTFCAGCQLLGVCLGPDTFFQVDCDGGQYCNTIENGMAVCGDVVPAGCETTTTGSTPPVEVASLQCTGVGFYPDPYDCNTFHYCSANRAASEVYRCPEGYGFHYTSSGSDVSTCQLLKSESDCLRVTCSGLSVFDGYDSAKLFYAHCHTNMQTGLRAIAMYRCTDGATFNGYECVFQCTEEGLFANTVEPTTYYQCYHMYGGPLTLRMLYCPRNLVFDNGLKKCV
ncbi:uncharacterized protein LOC131691589 [Topomyia yanbarensis]|uniref:uncharacterized protein LOC131691589 n=1 Tax=Topomyia yanbarensis TaxID=2498891 RepID=UPI00273B127F|nr:uncharacterized protein LOC131691589 [Topomyia yanbarensis]